MTDPTPDLCCTHGERIDRILELLEDRKAKREPKDGVYRVRVPESSRAWAYWEQRQIDEERAYDERVANADSEPEIPKPAGYATGGLVQAPEGYELMPFLQRGCDFVITPDEAYHWTEDTLTDESKQAFGRIFLNRAVKANESTHQTDQD